MDFRFRDQDMVAKFTKEARNICPEKPTELNEAETSFIIRMVMSELFELASTVSETPFSFISECLRTIDRSYKNVSSTEERITEQADAFVDVIYYIYDTCCKKGINLSPIFDAVHEANMKKRFPDGTFHLRESDNKILKPEGWTEPNVGAIVRKQLTEGNELF